MTEKIEDIVADLIAELRRRINELERRVASLELTIGKVQPTKHIGKVSKSKRRS